MKIGIAAEGFGYDQYPLNFRMYSPHYTNEQYKVNQTVSLKNITLFLKKINIHG